MRRNMSTFDTFVEYEQDKEPIKISKELLEEEGYESTYLSRYNFLSSRGWRHEKGIGWINPRDPSTNYSNIDTAFASQKLYEIMND